MTVYQNIDATLQALSKIARGMTRRGIYINPDVRAAHHKRLSESAAQAKAEFHEISKTPTKTKLGGSSPQIKKLFFEDWKIKPRTWTESGAPQLEKEFLQDLIVDTTIPDHVRGAARCLLRYREESKYDSTYAGVGYTDEFGAYGLEVVRHTSAFHPTWNVAAAKTLRWTSPAQQIPKPVELGGKIVRPGLRDMYCAREGMYLVEADFNSLEARFFAIYAMIDEMIAAILTGDKKQHTDIHSLNARAGFGVEKPSALERDLAKILLFGHLMYAGALETAYDQMRRKIPGLSYALLDKAATSIMTRYPEIALYRKEQMDAAINLGYSTLPLSGDRIYWRFGVLSGMLFGEPMLTEVLNRRIQRSGADAINPAMVRVAARLEKEGAGYLLMQVHDALVGETRDPTAMGRIFKEEMEQELRYRGRVMPLIVEMKYGPNLQNMQPLAA